MNQRRRIRSDLLANSFFGDPFDVAVAEDLIQRVPVRIKILLPCSWIIYGEIWRALAQYNWNIGIPKDHILRQCDHFGWTLYRRFGNCNLSGEVATQAQVRRKADVRAKSL
jgi:hypothetical protein